MVCVLLSTSAVLSAPTATTADSDSQKFIADYAAKEDSVVMPSGLIYRVLEAGTGGKPGASTPCSTHYEGRLSSNYPSGPTFDSSYARGQPTTFAPNQVPREFA